MELCRSLVGGKPVAGSRPPIDKHYPATGEVIARIEPADETVLDQAVAVAAEAQREWGAHSGAKRSAILQAAADGLRARNDELSRLEVMDVGKCYGEAVSADVPSGADAMAFFASMAMTETGDMHRFGDAIAYCERVPLGRLRWYRCVELSGADRLLESRPCTGGGQCLYPETVRGDPADSASCRRNSE